MKKSDLKAGYTIVDEQNRAWYLFDTKLGIMGKMINSGVIDFDKTLDVEAALNDDLTIKKDYMHPSCDIIKVYGFATYSHQIGETSGAELLWQRVRKFKVSEVEQAILKTLLENDYDYIARDSTGDLYAYELEPEKGNSVWIDGAYNKSMLLSAKYLLFIKWEDKEPYKITHILNNIA
jgi:hypothetical protein